MPLTWTIDDLPYTLRDYTANVRADLGPDQFRGEVIAAEAERFASTIDQGSLVRGYIEGDPEPKWEGTLSSPPTPARDGVRLAAQGPGHRAVKRTNSLLFCTADMGIWSDDQGSSPFMANDELISALPDGAETWRTGWRNTAYVIGDSRYIFADLDGDLAGRVKFSLRRQGSNANFQLIIGTFDAPLETTDTITGEATVLMNGALALSTLVGLRDGVAIGFEAVGNLTPSSRRIVEVYDIQVMGIGPGDPVFATKYNDGVPFWRVFEDTCERLGWTNAVPNAAPFLDSAMPLWWREAPWADMFTYLARLLGMRWDVLPRIGSGKPRLSVAPWPAAIDVSRASGAADELDNLELFNRVVVKYRTPGGRERKVVFDLVPDPLKGREINTYVHVLRDPQRTGLLATTAAFNIAAQIAARQSRGTIDLGPRLHDGRPSEYVRGGSQVRLVETNTTHKVFNATYTPGGVGLEIDAAYSLERLEDRAALREARGYRT